MLEVKPIQTFEEHEDFCRRCGIEADADALCYAAYEDDRLLGVCEFKMWGADGCAEMTALKNVIGVSDIESLFIMGRATLNYIDLHGVHEAIFTQKEGFDERLIKWIGFKLDEKDRWYMNLTGFFEEPCKH